jgi:hypothetical protein
VNGPANASPVEEHLLVREAGRARLAERDEHVRAMLQAMLLQRISPSVFAVEPRRC